jgi:hypothetical protein
MNAVAGLLVRKYERDRLAFVVAVNFAKVCARFLVFGVVSKRVKKCERRLEFRRMTPKDSFPRQIRGNWTANGHKTSIG